MELTPVESNNIDAIGFKPNVRLEENPDHYGTLRILFRHGSTYDYKNVPVKVYREFLESESKGKFFHARIKERFTYIRQD